jgi:hypothetical protein
VLPAARPSGKFIVLEGNRRLAALKILRNPAVLADLAIGVAARRRFERLAEAFAAAPIEQVDCFIVADQADAALWIQQRHTGENEGRGIVNWSGIARSRFRGQHPALQALDFALEHGDFSVDDRAAIDRFPITTLERLLSTPSVRKRLGLEIVGKRLTTQLPEAEAIRPLQKIIKDLMHGKVNVTKLKSKAQQEEYISSISRNLPDLSKATMPAREILSSQPPGAAAAQAAARRKARQPIRKVLIPKNAALRVTNPKIQEILNELQSLKLDQAPHAISVLFRVFLEISVDHYLDMNSIEKTVAAGPGQRVEKKFKAKIEDALTHMIAQGVDRRSLDGIRRGKDNKDSPLFVDTLHNYVHNRFFSPSERDLRISWDNSAPFFENIWK